MGKRKRCYHGGERRRNETQWYTCTPIEKEDCLTLHEKTLAAQESVIRNNFTTWGSESFILQCMYTDSALVNEEYLDEPYTSGGVDAVCDRTVQCILQYRDPAKGA